LTFTSARRYKSGDREDSLRGSDFVCTTVVTDKQGVLVVATDDDILTFSPSGKRLQWFDCYEDRIDVTEQILVKKSVFP